METAKTADRSIWWLVLVVLAAAPVQFWGLTARGFSDNEGMYAAAAQNMLLDHDWVTPHLNGAPYINKPPLIFWLIAPLFHVVGFTEAGRLISGVSTLLTAAAIYAVARELRQARPGVAVWSAVAFLTGVLTPVEGRTLRPDAVLVLCVTLSLLGALRLHRRPGDSLGGVLFWGGMGVGTMTQGLLGFVLPGLALVPSLLLAGEWRNWRRFVPWWGPGLFLGIVLPWHVLCALQTPGFAWDYIVNQHVLFFLDKKFPRDSVPISLPVMYLSLAGRLFPWLTLLPVAFVQPYRLARASRSVREWLLLSWFGTVVLFFSLNGGRQMHYTMPAIPAAAILAGILCDRWAGERRSTSGLLTGLALVALLGLLGVILVGPILRATGATTKAPGLSWVATQGCMLVAAGAGIATVLAKRNGPASALACLAATFYLYSWATVRSLDAAAAFNSGREIIARARVPEFQGATIAYEASREYQVCGTYNFYLEKDVVLLDPGGFIPPTYLLEDARRLFTPKEAFWREWVAGRRRILLFTDPDQAMDRPADFPAPYYEVARGGNRRLLTNLPVRVRQ